MKKSFIKALFACFLFALLSYFQNKDPVRENFEDISFDVISKLALSISEENTVPLVTVFTFDNAYMQNQNLFDKKQNPNYGYVFPRGKIAEFIDSLDQRLQNPENSNKHLYCPKALFIDFKLNFTSGADGQFSTGDQLLLNALKKPRCFKILLAKSGKHNFIEESKNESIQRLINEQQIIFVSPFLHTDSNNLIRRYEPTKNISGKLYPGAAIALWQIINNEEVDAYQAKKIFIDDVSNDSFKKRVGSNEWHNVNANMIWFKKYKELKADTLPFPQNSYWKRLEKYSLASTNGELPLQKIDSANFKDSVFLLGGTYQKNPKYYAETDYHKVLNFFIGTEKMNGIDIHANSLMTLLFLNGPMKQVPLFTSIVIIFIAFFLVDLIVTRFIQHKTNGHTALLILLVANLLVLFFISLYFLLSKYHLWFNWAIPLLLIELSEVIIFTRKIIPTTLHRIRKIKWSNKSS